MTVVGKNECIVGKKECIVGKKECIIRCCSVALCSISVIVLDVVLYQSVDLLWHPCFLGVLNAFAGIAGTSPLSLTILYMRVRCSCLHHSWRVESGNQEHKAWKTHRKARSSHHGGTVRQKGWTEKCCCSEKSVKGIRRKNSTKPGP